jgi:hypothetical protein
MLNYFFNHTVDSKNSDLSKIARAVRDYNDEFEAIKDEVCHGFETLAGKIATLGLGDVGPGPEALVAGVVIMAASPITIPLAAGALVTSDPVRYAEHLRNKYLVENGRTDEAVSRKTREAVVTAMGIDTKKVTNDNFQDVLAQANRVLEGVSAIVNPPAKPEEIQPKFKARENLGYSRDVNFTPS